VLPALTPAPIREETADLPVAPKPPAAPDEIDADGAVLLLAALTSLYRIRGSSPSIDCGL
jgi:hypothetical protein